jgi:hypothetical protein
MPLLETQTDHINQKITITEKRLLSYLIKSRFPVFVNLTDITYNIKWMNNQSIKLFLMTMTCIFP